MKALHALTLVCVVLLASLRVVTAQTSSADRRDSPVSSAPEQPQRPKGKVISVPAHPAEGVHENALAPLANTNPIPTWTYNITGYDGNPYTGTIMGMSPYNHGKTTTTIPTIIVPLVITIVDGSGTFVYDPTAPDNTCAQGHTAVETISNSPIFVNSAWTMNNVNVGTTQYEDANVRAEFWSLVGGTPYHLNLQVATLPAQPVAFGTGGIGAGQNYSPAQANACEEFGVVQTNDMQTAVDNLITGPLAGQVNVGTMVLFLTTNVVMSDGDTNLMGPNCCTLGFHTGMNIGANEIVFGPFAVDMAGAIEKGYSGTISHEVGEAIHDETGNNPTPPWGAVGQVGAGTCQANFEVGDPLSDNNSGLPTKDWNVGPFPNGSTTPCRNWPFIAGFTGVRLWPRAATTRTMAPSRALRRHVLRADRPSREAGSRIRVAK